jgi:hypothetical protein
MSNAAKAEKLQRGQHRATDIEVGAALAGALRCWRLEAKQVSKYV